MYSSINEADYVAWRCVARKHSQIVEPWTEQHVRVSTVPWERVVELRKEVALLALEIQYDMLEAKLNGARTLLELKEGFDGRDSPHYSKETLDRAMTFVKLQWQEYVRENGEPMPVPEIQPGPRGSIDVYWDYADLNLLVNIPADPAKRAEFAGDNTRVGRFDGNLDPTQPNGSLVSWLSA